MKYSVTVSGRRIEIDIDGEHLEIDGHQHVAHLTEVAGTPLRHLVLDGQASLLALRNRGQGQWNVFYRGETTEVEVLDDRTAHIRSLIGAGKVPTGPAVLRAPMPGLVLRILVEEGQEIAAETPVVVLEAMKMENELKAVTPGRVARVRVESGQVVEKGTVLIEFAR